MSPAHTRSERCSFLFSWSAFCMFPTTPATLSCVCPASVMSCYHHKSQYQQFALQKPALRLFWQNPIHDNSPTVSPDHKIDWFVPPLHLTSCIQLPEPPYLKAKGLCPRHSWAEKRNAVVAARNDRDKMKGTHVTTIFPQDQPSLLPLTCLAQPHLILN
jgi:hypothetical protein